MNLLETHQTDYISQNLIKTRSCKSINLLRSSVVDDRHLMTQAVQSRGRLLANPDPTTTPTATNRVPVMLDKYSCKF